MSALARSYKLDHPHAEGKTTPVLQHTTTELYMLKLSTPSLHKLKPLVPLTSHTTRSVRAMADAAKQRAAAEELQPGDHVEWGAPVPGRGKTSGEVVEVVTQDTDVKGNHFKASEDNPKVRVKSDKSGKEAVHKPASVHKV